MEANREMQDVQRVAAAPLAAASSAATIAAGAFSRLLAWDQATLLAARRWRTPGRTVVARALTRLGDASGWTLVGLAFFATFTPTGLSLGLRLGAAAGLATALSQALKRLLQRARPDLAIAGFVPEAANPDRFSFPSGHTITAFAILTPLLVFYPEYTIEFTFIGLSIASSRIILGMHFLSDVVVGAAVGTLLGYLSLALLS